MKKTTVLYAAFVTSLFISSLQAHAVAESIASVDGIRLMRESKEGQEVEEALKQEAKAFEAFLQTAQANIATKQDEIRKQAAVLSKGALQDLQENLKKTQRDLQRTVEDKRETLSARMQREQMRLREKQLKIANSVREEKGWLLMVEKTAPFVLGVAQATDKTDIILEAVNKEYAQTIAQAAQVSAQGDIKKS